MEDGAPFELPQLLRYTRGEYGLEATLARVRPVELGGLLAHMTAREPAQRPSAARCLQSARGVVLDDCFYSFACGFFGRLRLMDQPTQAAEAD